MRARDLERVSQFGMGCRLTRCTGGQALTAMKFARQSDATGGWRPKAGKGRAGGRVARSRRLHPRDNAQRLGSLGLVTRKLSCRDAKSLDVDSAEVQNFHGNPGLTGEGKKTNVQGARHQELAAAEAASARAERGENKTARSCEAGDHRGAERQMGQLVARIGHKNAQGNGLRRGPMRDALPAAPHETQGRALADGALRTYLKKTIERRYAAKQAMQGLHVLRKSNDGHVAKFPPTLCGGIHDRGRHASVREAAGIEAVRAFRQSQIKGAGATAGPQR